MTHDQPITICMVLASRGFGGLEKHFVELCNGLAARHHVVAVGDREFADQLDPKVVFEPLDISRSRHHPLLTLALRRILKRHKPHVVHSHANKAATIVKRASMFLPCRRVATIHNLKTATRMFKGFDRVIAVSRGVAERVNGSPVTVVYNGIDPPKFVRNQQHVPPQGVVAPYAAAVGRLVPAKGFDVLIEAWQGVPAKLVVAGEGPQRPLLEELIKKHNLHETVQLLGHCSRVPELLAAAEFTVVSSRHEGFGYVCVESLYARTPVVSTRIPVANEILPAHWLATPENADELRELILAAVRDPQGHQRDMESAYEFARKNFTREKMVEHTEAVYRSVLRGE